MSSITPIPSVSELSADHSLQAYIELVYIRAANEVMTDKMLELENGMMTTKSVMDSLTQIQQLKNLISVKSKGAFDSTTYKLSPPSGSPFSGLIQTPGLYSQYATAASAFFGTPVSVSISYAALSGTQDYAEFKKLMSALLAKITTEIAQLSAITKPLSGGGEDSNSLLAKMRIVLADAANTTASEANAIAWVTDLYNETSSTDTTDAGKLQQHITDAITAGQALNSTQTEDLRSFMYLYEEYYKSASAILTAITQIIQKMADGIAR
jgi:hypothetical protein